MEQTFFPVTRREAERQGIPFSSDANKNALFPSRLRQMREGKEVSQATLAKALGVSKSTIGLWETGDTLPDAKSVHDLAMYFGVPTDWLLGLSDVRSTDIDIQRICQKTGLDERIVKYIICLSSKQDTQTVLDHQAFLLYDTSAMDIFNEIFQPENIHGLLQTCFDYLHFVKQVKSDIEQTKYYLENPEEIECPELYYSFRSYYEDKSEYFKGRLEGEFLSALRENKIYRIEGMEKFFAVFDRFYKKYSKELEQQIQKIRELLAP